MAKVIGTCRNSRCAERLVLILVYRVVNSYLHCKLICTTKTLEFRKYILYWGFYETCDREATSMRGCHFRCTDTLKNSESLETLIFCQKYVIFTCRKSCAERFVFIPAYRVVNSYLEDQLHNKKRRNPNSMSKVICRCCGLCK